MTIQLLDLVAQYHTLKPQIDAAIEGVLESGHFILGPNVTGLEQEVAAYLGVDHGVGVASGTDALVLALRALKIGPGDEVIVPAYTFFATSEAVYHVGATPVIVDVDPATYAIDVAQIAAHITPRTKAIIPVHLYGHPADMDPIMALAEAHGLFVVEDCAQSMGARYRHGDGTWSHVGAIGHIGCLSFFPSKNLGAFGDGGMVVMNDAGLAERVRMLRMHGWRKKYQPEMVGYNSRLDALQAAILRVKLPYLDGWNLARRTLAAEYTARLGDLPVGLPSIADNVEHIFHLYILRVPDRVAFQAALKAAGVASAVYYPIPLHLTQPGREQGYNPGDLPISEQAADHTVAIPLYPEMTPVQVDAVIAAVRQASQSIS